MPAGVHAWKQTGGLPGTMGGAFDQQHARMLHVSLPAFLIERAKYVYVAGSWS